MKSVSPQNMPLIERLPKRQRKEKKQIVNFHAFNFGFRPITEFSSFGYKLTLVFICFVA